MLRCSLLFDFFCCTGGLAWWHHSIICGQKRRRVAVQGEIQGGRWDEEQGSELDLYEESNGAQAMHGASYQVAIAHSGNLNEISSVRADSEVNPSISTHSYTIAHMPDMGGRL